MGAKCVACGKWDEDYEPEYCCNGVGCGCFGKPIEPCLCSKECYENLFEVAGNEDGI